MAPLSNRIEIRPQPGPQSQFMSSRADVAIFGGSAGGGKTYALLLEAMYYCGNKDFGAVIFRKTNVQTKGEGGLWDESEKIYPLAGAKGSSHSLKWEFPSGAKVSFNALEYDKDRFNFQGQQFNMMAFDELTHFSAVAFWYLISRVRSTSGVPPYIRATCNPNADSFVATLIEWWIDQNTGYAIPERSGKLRWFIRSGDDLIWGDSKEELLASNPCSSPMSLTFIRSRLEDNQILMTSDPSYLAKLKNLPKLDREQLLHGNWKIRAAAGNYFRSEWFGEPVDAAPASIEKIRFWDRAATKPTASSPDPDWTVGLLLSKDTNGFYYVEDVKRFRESAHYVEQAMMTTAQKDGINVMIGYMQDAGSAGKGEAEQMARQLSGFVVKILPSRSGDKEVRAKPASSQAEAGNIKLVRGNWSHQDLLRELENFPEGGHDDQVDALSGAFNELASHVWGDVERVQSEDKWERFERRTGLM